MATMFCPDCAASLDAVPVGDQCPVCGGKRRSAHVVLEPLVARASVGEVRALVQHALDELASMPREEAREVVGELVQLSGRIAGTASLAGTLTVTRKGQAMPLTANAGLSTADGFATFSEAILERVHATDSCTAEVVPSRPAIELALAHPDARAVLLNLVSNGLYDLLKYGLLVYLTAKVACDQPAFNFELHYHAAPSTSQHEPAPQQVPLPSGDVCLPPGGRPTR